MKLKGPSSGCENNTYWGSIRFFNILEEEEKKAKKELNKKVSPTERKRKREEENSSLDNLLVQVNAVVLPPLPALPAKTGSDSTLNFDYGVYEEHAVYDTCDDVRKKSLEFMAEYNVNKTKFLKVIGDVNQKSWENFMSFKGKANDVCINRQPGAGNSSYWY
jgi:hypothetical protein